MTETTWPPFFERWVGVHIHTCMCVCVCAFNVKEAGTLRHSGIAPLDRLPWTPDPEPDSIGLGTAPEWECF